jgi:dTDP-4-amino-4,6-dideoxygalactose transaminase
MFIESLTAKTRVRQKFLPFVLPSISDEEINEVTQTLRSGWLTSGPKTKLFEKKFAEYNGCRHAIAVNSGSAGLHLSLIASSIKSGDEIILPALTFASTANVVTQCGARPIFADVGDDMNIKVSEIPRLINSKTKAILPVDFAGQPAALTEISAIANKHNLVIIEDAAHAVGSSYRGSKIGSVSPITVFSFEQSNIMTTGDGGMICTNNDKIAEKIRNLNLCVINYDIRKVYSSQDARLHEFLYPSYNYNMSDIHSAIGLCQLAKLNQFIAIRRHYADIYYDAFRFIPEISLPPISQDSFHSWHLFIIVLNLNKLTINRSQFIEALHYENIGAGVPVFYFNQHPYYSLNRCHDSPRIPSDKLTPNAEWLSERLVALPLYPKMSEKDIFDTIRAIKKITKRMAK